MNAQQIIDVAKAEHWKRKQVKEACYQHKISLEEREAIYASLGMAPTQAAPTPEPEPEPAPRVIRHEGPKPAKPFGNFTLKYDAVDKLTGKTLVAGTRVIGFKIGGEWDFTAEQTDEGTFRKVCEAALFSNGVDEGGPDGELDSDDYRLLASYGNEYPYFTRFIACHVPGLHEHEEA